VSGVISDILHGVLSQYHQQYGLADVPIKVDFLKPMIEERGCVDRIIWEKYDFEAKNIAAQISFFEAEMGVYAGVGQYARIQYSSSLNFSWQRYVVCKEMYHCIIDASANDRVTNMAELNKLAEYLVEGPSSAVEPFQAHSTEDFAEILALETLFPMELRTHHRADYDAGKITPLQLALRYRIPQGEARAAMYPNYFASIQSLREGKLVAL